MPQRLAALITVAGVSAGVLVAAAPVGASERHGHSTVAVHAAGGNVTLSRHTVQAGRVRLAIDTTNASGSNVVVFRPIKAVTLATVFADFGEAFSSDPMTAAKGTRDLTHDARFYGGADVLPSTPAVVTENLNRGTYYLVDVVAPPGPTGPSLATLTVRGHEQESESEHHNRTPVVRLTSADRFIVHGRLHARGSVTVANISDTIHFMEVQPVKDGTTDAEIQAAFDGTAQGPPPFVDGPSVGMEVQSPGHRAVLKYSLPKGTYVLLCFIPDDVTGMPHALMGMHKVVVLT